MTETAESLTATEQKRLWQLMANIVPDGKVFAFFTVKNDYKNLKSVLKAFYSGKDTAAGYTPPEVTSTKFQWNNDLSTQRLPVIPPG